MYKTFIEIHPEYCNGCGACVDACLKHLIVMRPDPCNPEILIAHIKDRKRCVGCGSCALSCPQSAITVD